MRYTEAERLRSEMGTVESFLAALPADAVLERLSWQSRLELLQARLAEVESKPQATPLSLTFRGTPVEGTRSIDATFASKALKSFVEATETVTASLVKADLRDHGPLPTAGGRALRVVDTAVGSFGFELELPPPAEAPQAVLPAVEVADPYVEAIATTLRLLDQAAREDDDAVSDLIAEIHPRAAAKVRAFAAVLDDHDARFAVAFRGKQVRLDAPEQVRRVMATLAESNISEQDETHQGTLLGVLPASRRFEARLAERGVVSGRVGQEVADIAAFKGQWENKEAQLTVRVVRFRSRIRYVLLDAVAPGEGVTGGGQG